jgi:adenylate kinase
MRFVLLGPPGAGKGSLAGLIKDEMGILHISTGDMLRDEMKKGSQLGLQVKSLIEQGALVPDELITKLVEQKINTDQRINNGFMLDGYPRTTQQAQDLDKILARIDKPLDFVLCMNASLDLILTRLTGRRVCRKCGALFHIKNKPSRNPAVCDICGGELYQRADDNEETISKRMKVYDISTKPIIDYYTTQGKIKNFDGDKETVELRNDLIKMMNEDKSYKNQKSSRN